MKQKSENKEKKENKEKTKALVIFSGGQDSTTCLYYAIKNFDIVHAITFSYGQRHSVEIDCAKEICESEKITHKIVDLTFYPDLIKSALVEKTTSVSEKNQKGLPASFVPNRNQLFITIAHAYAQKIGAKKLIVGACETDYSGYPDCRAEFLVKIQDASNYGSDSSIKILAPLMRLTKAETFEFADNIDRLNDIIEKTHTCYEGKRDSKHFHDWGYGCGKCPACKLRKSGYNEFMALRS